MLLAVLVTIRSLEPHLGHVGLVKVAPPETYGQRSLLDLAELPSVAWVLFLLWACGNCQKQRIFGQSHLRQYLCSGLFHSY